VRIVAEKHAGSLHADAAAAVRVIHEDDFATVGEGFFKRRELAYFGAEGGVLGDGNSREQREDKAQLVKDLG
jgi:hypothetical protein